MIILEIQTNILRKSLEQEIKHLSKFYEIFGDRIIAILFDSQMNKIDLTLIKDKRIIIETYILNNFAKNRLINNFEKAMPELTFTIMGCDENSKLIKIWWKNDK